MAPEGESPALVAAPHLLTVPLGGWRYEGARMLHAVLPYLPFAWLAAGLVVVAAACRPLVHRLGLAVTFDDRGLFAVLVASGALNVAGISWGLGGH